MRKWQTIAVTALSTLALSGAGFATYQASQPAQYKGETFVNEKHNTSHSTNSNMASSTTNNGQSSPSVTDSSSDTTVPTQSSSVEQPITVTGEPTKPLQMGGAGVTFDRPLTFSVYDCGIADSTIGRIEVGCVVCNEILQKTRVIPIEDCEPFAQWMRSIASDKTNLDNSMDSNYNYWVQNVKGQQ